MDFNRDKAFARKEEIHQDIMAQLSDGRDEMYKAFTLSVSSNITHLTRETVAVMATIKALQTTIDALVQATLLTTIT